MFWAGMFIGGAIGAFAVALLAYNPEVDSDIDDN